MEFYDIKGGLNNWTKGVKFVEGEYIIRVYNNGKNLEKVKLEHETMLKLENIEKSF